MKQSIFVIALVPLTFLPISIQAQNVEGQIIASQYGEFSLTGTAENSFVFSPSNCQVSGGGKNFNAFTQGVPVRVIEPGNPSLNEIVVAGLVNISACSVQLATHNDHLPPFYLTSGTAGLQEAINANSKGIANTIILSADWYALGGSPSIISSVTGTASLGLVDVTTTPFTWYAWNGSEYVATEPGTGCSSGCVTELNNISGGMALTPGSNITIAPSGQNIKISATTGVPSVNGVTAATTIAPGSNITVSTTGNTITIASAGGAGSGAVALGTQYQDTTYPNSGSATTVGALTNKYTFPTGLSTSQLNTWFSGASSSTATIQNGDADTPFANPNFDGVQDLRETYPVKPWDVRESGAQCDLQGGFGSVTQGSPTLTFTSGYSASASDVGKYIEMVYEVSGEPTRFDAEITGFTNSSTVTLSTNAPFTVSEYTVDVGHRDDAAIKAAFDQFSYQRPIEFPIGNCWSDTIAVWGQSFHGLSSTRSLVSGLAGDDVFAALDPTNSGYEGQSPDMQIYDMKWEFDPRINASQPWQDVNASGTVTQHAATYRPTGLMTVWANYPLGPGWIKGPGANNTGAMNGVAVTTQNSAVICIPSTETEPSTGDKIIFPYFSTIFTSTVSSLSGTGCTGGTNPLTMEAAFPNTSGYTTTQSEWMAGTSVQTIQTNIPATGRTFPMTVTLANPITPPLTTNWANTASNVAPYGLVQIDGEQFSYFGNSAYPASSTATPSITLTAGAQNGTTAASHSVDATIVPLNPFQPTWPWPVMPSLNSGTMPANATFFPAWDIGNAGWAEPWYNGADLAANGGLSFARFHDITITIPDFYAGSGGGTEGGPNSFQVSNATTGMYITRLPFGTKFYNLHIIDPQFGIFEGEPSINTYGLWAAYPTTNGSSWDNITIQSAGYDTLFIGGQNDSKTNFLTFCQNGGETGTSNPGQALGVVGCGAAWIWGGTYNDQAGGGGSDNNYDTYDNWYIEEENGSQAGAQPYYEFNCGVCTYGNAFGGGTIFVEGANNNFKNASIVAGADFPLINYGASTTMSHIAGLGSGGVSNTYGGGFVLNYGPNASMMGNVAGNAYGPFGNLAPGTMTTVDGQTGDSFATGNDTAPYVSPSSAMIYPYEFGDYVYDSTAPISLSHHSCPISPGSGCYQSEFINNSDISIGPGQRLSLGSYIAHYAVKTPAGANTFTFDLRAVDNGSGSCSTPATVYTATVSTSGTDWTQFTTAPISFASNSGCTLAVEWTNGATADTMQVAYLVFSPVWTDVTLPVKTPADNAVCVPGSFIGSDSSYLYICTASGTVKRAALGTY